ncbi:MAG: AI-2E family transporter, partial [Candidatus Poseidoniaceae archaeon]|nr:AI-2E family transporter [Candidatus Poseidoniaceae archaeon]
VQIDSVQFARRLGIITNFCVLLALLIFAAITLEDVLKPFIIALGVYFILKPVADALNKTGFNLYLSYFTVLMMFLLLLVSSAYYSYSQIGDLMDDEDKMAEYNSNLEQRYIDLKDSAIFGSAFGDGDEENMTVNDHLVSFGLIQEGEEVSDLFGQVLAFIGGLGTTAVTVLFFLMFIIFEAGLLPGRISAAYPGEANEKINEVRADIEDSINVYIIVKTGVGVGTAGIAGIILASFGIDLWFLWALLTFILNYVPYIGSLVASIPPLLLGFIMLEPSMVIFMGVLLIVNQQIWGNVIETKWCGSKLDISPVLLLIVAAFGYWLWGIIGMVLSVPFVVIFKIILENIEPTRPIAILMSERAPDLLEAYQDALADGVLTSEEISNLSRIQHKMGFTDETMDKMAGLAAINHALETGTVSEDETKLVLRAADMVLGSRHLKMLKTSLKAGIIDEHAMEAVQLMLARLSPDEEE